MHSTLHKPSRLSSSLSPMLTFLFLSLCPVDGVALSSLSFLCSLALRWPPRSCSAPCLLAFAAPPYLLCGNREANKQDKHDTLPPVAVVCFAVAWSGFSLGGIVDAGFDLRSALIDGRKTHSDQTILYHKFSTDVFTLLCFALVQSPKQTKSMCENALRVNTSTSCSMCDL